MPQSLKSVCEACICTIATLLKSLINERTQAYVDLTKIPSSQTNIWGGQIKEIADRRQTVILRSA